MKGYLLVFIGALLLVFSQITHAQTFVSEESVQGRWALTGSPYIVTGNLKVEEGTILEIDAGVTVKFTEGASIKVNGQIIANGSIDKHIYFTSIDTLAVAENQSKGWNGILLQYSDENQSLFRYCEFTYCAESPVYLYQSKAWIDRCIIRQTNGEFKSAIKAYGWSDIVVTNSLLSSNDISSVYSFWYNIVSIEKSTCFFAGNLFHSNRGQIAFHDAVSYVYNNTIVNNRKFEDNPIISFVGGKARVRNNIFWGNGQPAVMFSESMDNRHGYEDWELSHCFVENGIEGISDESNQLVSGSIFQESLHLKDDYSLQSNSLAINTGAELPEQYKQYLQEDFVGNLREYDGGDIDIGAFEYQDQPDTLFANFTPIPTQRIFTSSSKLIPFPFNSNTPIEDIDLTVSSNNSYVKVSIIEEDKILIDPHYGYKGTTELQLKLSSDAFDLQESVLTICVSDTVETDIIEDTYLNSDTVVFIENITVAQGAELKIKKGAVVKFADNCRLDVYGNLSAGGSADEKMLFTATGQGDDTTRWQGVHFYSNADTTILDHCIFEFVYANAAISGEQGSFLQITNTVFKNCDATMWVTNGTSIVNVHENDLYLGNCLFYDNVAINAIVSSSYTNSTITNCTFYNCTVPDYKYLINVYDRAYGVERRVDIQNSIFAHSSNILTPWYGVYQSPITVSNCLVDGIEELTPTLNVELENVVYAPANFTDTTNRDFTLTQQSSAIDIGRNQMLEKLNGEDLFGRDRIYSEGARVVDAGVFEYQGEPDNRKPEIENIPDITLMNGMPVPVAIFFSDPDINDSHTISFHTDHPGITFNGQTGHTSGSTINIDSEASFVDTATIIVTITDQLGALNTISFNCYYNINACGTIWHNEVWEDTVIVACQVTVSEDAELTILPGTRVIFLPGSSLLVNGKLHAQGTEEDSIYFQSPDTLTAFDGETYHGWGGIVLEHATNPPTLKYCNISGATKFALITRTSGTPFQVLHSSVHHNGGGIQLFDSENALVKDCHIYSNRDAAVDIWSKNSRIENNLIEYNISTSKGAVHIYQYTDSTVISNNVISHNQTSYGGAGISGSSVYTTTITGNFIHHNSSNNQGSRAGGIYLEMSKTKMLQLSNNVFYENHTESSVGSDAMTIYYGSLQVNNNTFYGHDDAITFRKSYGNFHNNIIWDIQNTTLSFIGSDKPIYMNNNILQGGTDSITYEEIYDTVAIWGKVYDKDPLLTDPTALDFSLQSSSPAINMGTLDTTGLGIAKNDFYGKARIYNSAPNRIDIGATEFQANPANRPPLFQTVLPIQLFPTDPHIMRFEYADPDGDQLLTFSVGDLVPGLSSTILSSSSEWTDLALLSDGTWAGDTILKVYIEDQNGAKDSLLVPIIVSDTVCGEITKHTIWATDTVFVGCNVFVMSGATLTIKPGTVVAYTGDYKIIVRGAIQAEGTPDNRITFVSADTLSPQKASIQIQTKEGVQEKCFFKYCDFSNTYANEGGAVYINSYRNVTFSHCTFRKCYAGTGGAIYNNFSTVLVDSCLFIGNGATVDDKYPSRGGAIYSGEYSSLTVSNSRFLDHVNGHVGAAIYCYESTSTVVNNYFSGNDAGMGGAVCLTQGGNKCTVIGNIFTHNNSRYQGSGLCMSGTKGAIINNTFAYNSSGTRGLKGYDEGAVYISAYGEYTNRNTILFYNNILYNNVGANTSQSLHISGDYAVVDIYSNLIEGGLAGVNGYDKSLDAERFNYRNFDFDPIFTDGENGNVSLLPESPAINAGTINIANGYIFERDLYGNPRIYEEPLQGIDLGAIEYQGSVGNHNPYIDPIEEQYLFTGKSKQVSFEFFDFDGEETHIVSITSDQPAVSINDITINGTIGDFWITSDGVWEGTDSVQISVTDNSGAFTSYKFPVHVGKYLCGNIQHDQYWDEDTIIVSCDVVIEPHVKVEIAPGTNILFQQWVTMTVLGTLSAVGTEGEPIVFTSEDKQERWGGVFIRNQDEYQPVSFEHCIVEHAAGYSNGAIVAENVKSLFINHCLFRENGQNTPDIYGGALYADKCRVNVQNSHFQNNKATNGGAIYATGNEYSSSVTVINSLFTNNEASSYGGAIYSAVDYHWNWDYYRVNIINSTIANNLAYKGGGVYAQDRKGISLTNTVFSGNDVSRDSKDLNVDDEYTRIFINNCVFQDSLQSEAGRYRQFNNVFYTDPLFTNPTSGAGYGYESQIQDWALPYNSVCFNGGITEFNKGYEDLPFDINGNKRVSSSAIDIGPFELPNRIPLIGENIFVMQENPNLGQLLGLLNAEDPDGEELVFYSESNIVSVSDSGYITILDSTALDHETVQLIEFPFTVSDADTTIKSRAIIVIENINDNTPEVSDLPVSILVVENSPYGTELFTVSATDADEDVVDFIISPEIASVSESGKVFISDSSGFDYEQQDSILLTIIATDGLFADTASVWVILTDDLSDNHITKQEEAVVCGSYEFANEVLTESGLFYDSLKTIHGADSVIQLQLIVNEEHLSVVQKNVAFGEKYQFGDKLLDVNGLYEHTFTSVEGCDSTVNLEFTVLAEEVILNELTITACGSYSFAEKELTQSGEYYDTLLATNGQDSIIILDLTVKQPYYQTIEESIPAGSYFVLGDQILTEEGTYNHRFTAQNGCDSLVQLELQVETEVLPVVQMTKTTCEAYDFNGTTLLVTGVYRDTLYAGTLPVSVVELDLTVNKEYIFETQISLTYGEEYLFGDQLLNQSGQYSHTFTSVLGCDSIINLTLTIAEPESIFHSDTISSCGGHYFAGQLITESGTFRDTIQSASGADSISELVLTVNPEYDISFEHSITEGESYQFGNEIITESGIYNQIFTTTAGCDSSVSLLIIAHPLQASQTEIEVVACHSYIFGERELFRSGIYFDTLSASNGADSIIQLDLEINQIYDIEIERHIDKNEIYEFGGTELNTSGMYSHVFVSEFGCDSTVTLKLTVEENHAPYFEEDTITVIVNTHTVSGKRIASVQATDNDGDALTYSLTGGSGRFSIDNKTGEISIVNTDNLTDKLGSPIILKVTATDGIDITNTVVIVDLFFDINNLYERDIDIYPTIAKDYLKIDTPTHDGLYRISTTNGITRYWHPIPDNGIIDLPEFSQGVYFITVKIGSVLLTQQFVVQ